MMNKPKLNPYLIGSIGFLIMIVFYYLLLLLTTKDPLHPFLFFLERWYFLAPIMIGFGIQMYLFQKLRFIVHENKLAMAGASASAGGVAMVACCAHHLADLFPVLGFMGIATTMSKYQDLFLAIGAVVNIFGIWYMWLRVKKQKNMSCTKT